MGVTGTDFAPTAGQSPMKQDLLPKSAAIANWRYYNFMVKSVAIWLNNAKIWACSIKRDVVALWIAARDSKTPLIAKLVAGGVTAYAPSPIYLIPDFIPLIGYLDDLLIVPLGIMLAVSMIPSKLMGEFRATAAAQEGHPLSQAGLLVIIAIWISCAVIVGWMFWPR
jgi:uncharacterized membrane protein YkvA (DUF1232 family)